MPAGDRTGPWGMGPLTGRMAGFCAGLGVPGYANPVGGRMFGHGGGRGGRGQRHWFYATGLPGWARAGYPPAWGAAPLAGWPSPEQEVSLLKAQADHLKAALENVEQRLAELEATAGKSAE